jgi:F-type H+-transporting ATPase subunit epsilon
VSVVTPEGAAFSGPAASVVVPAHDGEVAFLPGHAAFVASLGYGELRIQPADGPARRLYAEGGVVQVLRGVVTVLAEQALPAEKVDAAKARADLDRANAVVAVGDAAAGARERAILSARARLAVAGKA